MNFLILETFKQYNATSYEHDRHFFRIFPKLSPQNTAIYIITLFTKNEHKNKASSCDIS